MTHAELIRSHIQKFETTVATMAWGIAERIFEEQKKHLVSSLSNVTARVAKKPAPAVTNNPTKMSARLSRALQDLNSKKGTWDRGSGAYKVIGPGKESLTFDLENVATGKKINATLKTLGSRWKHTP